MSEIKKQKFLFKLYVNDDTQGFGLKKNERKTKSNITIEGKAIQIENCIIMKKVLYFSQKTLESFDIIIYLKTKEKSKFFFIQIS